MTGDLDWLAEGRELGPTLDQHHAIVVVGADPTATALVALGIGRAQASRRRVAVGDLIGDAPPLQALVGADDVHGLVDSFMYGVSLNRVAYLVAGERELFVMPSGTSPIDYDELLLNPRWRRLAAGFREVGALLVLAAPAHATHLRHLVDATDGAVLVGDEVPASLSVAQSLAWVREKKSAPITVAGPAPTAEPDVEPEVLAAQPVAELARRVPWPAWAPGVALTLVLIGAGAWFWQRPFVGHRDPNRGGPGDAAAAVAVTRGALATDSMVRTQEAQRDAARRDSAARAANLAVADDSFPVFTPLNPGDSATASGFAVLLENTNGLTGAIFELSSRFPTLPATSYALSLRSRLFELVSGAYATQAEAESLLVDLRARRVLGPAVGNVIVRPYAFLVQAGVPPGEVPARLRRTAARAQPVYALRQPNGAANLYFGAYESPQQAALAVPDVRKAGITPTLVYRIGRVF